MDTNFLKAHAERCRRLAENADEFTKRRLLNLAAHYDKRLAGAGPSVDQGYDGLGNTLDTTAAATSVALATDSGLAGTTPPSIAPTLSIADDSLWVAGRGGTVDLGLSVSTTDPNDAVTVNIRGLPKYETITDNLDGHTFTGKNITLTAAEVNSGLTLQSNYLGSDEPVATLTVTATGKDPVTNAVTTSAPQTITVVDPLPATAPTTGATPAVIVNIKTDFGAACNGIDSDYAAFQAFNAWALQWQQSHSGLIELDIPPGSICMFSQSGEGSWFAKGIKQLLVKGYGATLSDDNGVGGFVLGGGGIESGNGGFGSTESWTARAATVSAGSDSITLLDPSRTSIFSVGTWALMTGLDLMGYGYPPNPQFFEYVQITAINPTTGQVTFAAPLKNSYESTWPNYWSGTPGLYPDQGGPATLYALDPSWDTEVEYDGLTINQAGQIYANGRSVTFKDCNFNDGAEIPSQNMTWTIQNVNMPSSMIEVDKLVTTMNVTGGTLYALAFQSASVDTLNMNGTTVSSFMNGTPKTAYLSNDNIAHLGVGAYAYGASSEVSITNSVLGSITALGVYENGNGSGVQTEYSMSNGVITSPNSNGPLRWAVPGSTVIWSGQYGWEGEFKVLDVTQDANNTYVRTTMSDGFPSLGTVLALRVDPAVKFTSINNTGSPEALSLSQAPAGAPLYSYSNHTYSGNFGKAPSFEQWGELVSIKIDVIKPYTGSKSSLDMEVLGQFGPWVLDPDGSISRIDPTINLKVAGERYITSTSVTGLQPGDNISAPGPVSFTGSLNAFMGLNGTLADISSDDPSTWPIVSIEIVTDQGYGWLGNTLSGPQVDPILPEVTQATASPGTGTEHVGDTVTLTLGFNEAVTVGGAPTLSLNDGATATYVGGSGTSALTFSTTVASTNTNTSALAITGVNLPNGASIKDSSGVAANLAGAVKTFTGLQISTTTTTPTTPTPPSIAPTLSIADDSLWVAGRGGTVDLGLHVSTTDPNDAVTVNIRGLPKYETITDNLDRHTFRGKNITLTAAEVNSGLTLQSNYRGSDQPVATLTVTATGTDPVTNAVTTSAPQTITVVDPPPATAPTRASLVSQGVAQQQLADPVTSTLATTAPQSISVTDHLPAAAASAGFLANQGFALLQEHMDSVRSTLATTAPQAISFADHLPATGATTASRASQSFALLNQYLASNSGRVDPGQIVAAVSQGAGWGQDWFLTRPQH